MLSLKHKAGNYFHFDVIWIDIFIHSIRIFLMEAKNGSKTCRILSRFESIPQSLSYFLAACTRLPQSTGEVVCPKLNRLVNLSSTKKLALVCTKLSMVICSEKRPKEVVAHVPPNFPIQMLIKHISPFQKFVQLRDTLTSSGIARHFHNSNRTRVLKH